jgi:hypothetical protein
MRWFHKWFGQRKAGGKAGNQGRSVRLSVEALEARDTPSHGSGLATAWRQFGGLFAPAQADRAVSEGGGSSGTSTLRATLTGATGTLRSATFGRVSYSANASAGTSSLLVGVFGLTANSTYTVRSGSTTLGTITTDANGNGALLASSVSAALASGDTVRVADAAGTTVLSGTVRGLHRRRWHRADAWLKLHAVLLAELNGADPRQPAPPFAHGRAPALSFALPPPMNYC